MGIIASNVYLAAFGAGTLTGATTAYFILTLWPRVPPKEQTWKNGLEFEPTSDEFRLILGVRNDLKMSKGKVAAQCGHAAVAAYAKATQLSRKTLKRWLKYGGTKIAVRVDSEQDLLDLERKSKLRNVLVSVVWDAGQGQMAPGTRTVIAIGPAPKSVLDQITGHLKLY